jgi:WD40 repeat protein/pimeloyl-ACP methyl ester carboxylesterase
MAGAVHRRSVTWAVTCALLLAALTVSAGRASSGTIPACQAYGVSQQVTQGKTPILFVHGILSTSGVWTSNKLPQGATITEPPMTYVVGTLGGGQVAGYTFDWSYASGKEGPVEWVTGPPSSPTLGQRLTQAISCLAKTSGHQVIIIAHSMGGLIAQDASALDPKDNNGDPRDIAAVFTLGTPYQGSWLASEAVQKGPSQALNVLAPIIEYGCSTPNAVKMASLCQLVNDRNDPGMVGMRLSPGPQNELPPRPAGLPWYPLATSVQGVWQPVWPLQIKEQLNYVGDGVVSPSSQLAGGSSNQIPTCPIIERGDLPSQPSIVDAYYSSCFHILEPFNKDLLDEIINIILTKHMIPTASLTTEPPTSSTSLPRNWQRLRTLTDPSTGEIDSMAISPTGGMLATGSLDGSSYLWNTTSGQLIATITQASPSAGAVSSLAFSPDGKTLAVGLSSGMIVLRDVATMSTVATLTDNAGGGSVPALAFSPDGTMLAAADLGGRGAYLWDVATGRQLALLSTSIGAVTSVAFSPNGKTLSTGGDDGTVLWNVASQSQIATFGISGSGPIISGEFSPNGSLLATGGFDGAVLWNLATGHPTAILRSPAPLADTTSVAFSPDGAILATAGVNTPLWATATGAKIATIPVTAGAVAFSPQGQTLATTSGNSVVLWTPAS